MRYTHTKIVEFGQNESDSDDDGTRAYSVHIDSMPLTGSLVAHEGDIYVQLSDDVTGHSVHIFRHNEWVPWNAAEHRPMVTIVGTAAHSIPCATQGLRYVKLGTGSNHMQIPHEASHDLAVLAPLIAQDCDYAPQEPERRRMKRSAKEAVIITPPRPKRSRSNMKAAESSSALSKESGVKSEQKDKKREKKAVNEGNTLEWTSSPSQYETNTLESFPTAEMANLALERSSEMMMIDDETHHQDTFKMQIDYDTIDRDPPIKQEEGGDDETAERGYHVIPYCHDVTFRSCLNSISPSYAASPQLSKAN